MKLYTIRGDLIWPSRGVQDQEEAKRRFKKMVLNRENWLNMASRLTFAMRQLEPSVRRFWCAALSQGTDHEEPFPPEEECVAIHLMLGGFATENLCKGYLCGYLSDTDKAALDRGELPARLKSKHKIAELIRGTGFQTTAEEDELIVRVEDCVEWVARYPVPMVYRKLEDEALAAHDVDRINGLISRLRDYVLASQQPGR